MDSPYKACSVTDDDFTNEKFFSRYWANFKCYCVKHSLLQNLFRYFGLLNICLLSFGLYFCYDNPGSLQDKFTEIDVPTTKFVLLYSVYSWPNVVLCFFGGFLLDSVFGIKWGTILYMFLALSGQLLFAMGTYVDIFWLMVLGRFIFGIGSEAVYIAQNNYTVLWFRGHGLNALFGLQSSIGLAGSVINNLSTGSVYKFVSENSDFTKSQCIGVVLFIASTTLGASMICSLVLGCMHNYTERVLKQEKVQRPPDGFKLADIKTFNSTYWLVILLCTAYTVALSPFISLAQGYFTEKYNYDADRANRLNSLVYAISAVTSPLFGLVIDKFGRNIIWVIIGIIGSLFAHGLLTFTELRPKWIMIALGLFSSLFGTSIWPMIAHVMPEHQLGTAYGINQALLNLSIAIASIICGYIVEKYGYFELDLFFLAWLVISMIPAVMIWKNISNDSRRQFDDEKLKTASNVLEEGLLQSTDKTTNIKVISVQQEKRPINDNYLNG